jgi:hypothetical protein
MMSMIFVLGALVGVGPAMVAVHLLACFLETWPTPQVGYYFFPVHTEPSSFPCLNLLD